MAGGSFGCYDGAQKILGSGPWQMDLNPYSKETGYENRNSLSS